MLMPWNRPGRATEQGAKEIIDMVRVKHTATISLQGPCFGREKGAQRNASFTAVSQTGFHHQEQSR